MAQLNIRLGTSKGSGQNYCLKCLQSIKLLTKVDSVSQAECTPEPLQPIYTPRESKIVLLSRDEIDAIEKITVGQADNEAWHQQREGRITASSFYRVFTKVESMKASKENSADKLVDSLLGKAKTTYKFTSSQIWQRYGADCS